MTRSFYFFIRNYVVISMKHREYLLALTLNEC